VRRFVGNICIKSWESLVKFFGNELRDQLQANLCRTAGAFLPEALSPPCASG